MVTDAVAKMRLLRDRPKGSSGSAGATVTASSGSPAVRKLQLGLGSSGFTAQGREENAAMSPPDDQSRLTLRYESVDDHPLQHTLTVMMAASHMPLAAPPMRDGQGIPGKVLELKGQLALLHRCGDNPGGRGTAAQV